MQFLLRVAGIVGRISPKTWGAMEVFLGSIATEEYEAMVSALIDMGATNTDVDSRAFARDLDKIFSSIQVFILMFVKLSNYFPFAILLESFLLNFRSNLNRHKCNCCIGQFSC